MNALLWGLRQSDCTMLFLLMLQALDLASSGAPSSLRKLVVYTRTTHDLATLSHQPALQAALCPPETREACIVSLVQVG